LGGSAAMQKQHFMIIVQLHQIFCEISCFIHHSLEQWSAVTDFKNR
jgi:hypothetical protein